jgi:hypothetical protein
MGHFYFYMRNGDELILNDQGQDLPDGSAVRREAIPAAREILAEAIRAGQPKVPDAIVISDGAGRRLMWCRPEKYFTKLGSSFGKPR